MRTKIGKYLLIIAVLYSVTVIVEGCSSKEEKGATSAKPVMAPAPAINDAPTANSTPPQTPSSVPQANAEAGTPGIAVEVNGETLTKKQLDADTQEKLVLLKGQIPPENLEQAKAEIKRGIVDEFVIRTLLNKETLKRKVSATEKDVEEIMTEMKAKLPAGMTIEEFLKKNNIDAAKMREEITMNIKINKLVAGEVGSKVKITDKEIEDFYNKNQDKFRQPETVHARHILVATTSDDNDKLKGVKKRKTEDLRKQLLAGADFASVASKNSDCPSKQNGGDLGSFARGQMVKPFEDAAFSQAKNEVGPVVQTDFGFHIIQVLEHRSAQVTKLDGETRKQIGSFLESQKQQEGFDRMVKRLKSEANIVVYGK